MASNISKRFTLASVTRPYGRRVCGASTGLEEIKRSSSRSIAASTALSSSLWPLGDSGDMSGKDVKDECIGGTWSGWCEKKINHNLYRVSEGLVPGGTRHRRY
ncbi:hypothetical protein OsI_24441 [Oryza sativa Indica Group]|uniref:Uncharacterized protein n=2 Tax=Oryza TaxID=4527 RepID=A0A0E0HVB5_ORYNI|nr:hypothetical protein OsI_24441 [Oryza sativa Indica Group]